MEPAPSATSGERRTFHTLDALRGVAALLVITRHSDKLLQGLDLPETFLAVDFFFMLSGVVIAHSYERRLLTGMSTYRFMLLRLIRLYPIYAIGIVIGAAQLLASHAKAGPAALSYDLIAGGIALATAMLPSGGYPAVIWPRWSLTFELIANLVYAAALRRLTNRACIAIVVVSGVGFITVAVGQRTYDIGYQSGLFHAGLMRVGFSFFLGILLQRAFSYRRRQNAWIAWGMVGLLILLLALHPSEQVRLGYETLVLVAALPAIVWVSMHFDVDDTTARIFTFLGIVSYAIYILHEPVALMVEGFVKRLTHDPSGNVGLSFSIVYLTGLVAICWSIDRWFDKPVRRWLTTRVGLSRP